MSKLSDVRGRITYISSHARQENLYAVYETTNRHYWTELAKCNQQEFQKSGTEGKCIEAREFIIALPESFSNLYEPDKLLQLFTDRFKEKYGVECVSALHHNKRKTNYHIHLIFSERERLPEPIEKTATRNMFYDKQGKHVRTKKEILDENGLYLATKKIGKNNPKAEQIQTDNEYRMRWNCEVDRAIISGVAETEIQQIKKEYISDRIKESIDIFGSRPERFGIILMSAVAVLAMLISKVLQKARELSAKLYDTEQIQPQMPVQEPVCQPAEKETQIKPKIPPKPVMPAEAAAYPKLFKIYKELKRQNEIIFEAEKERNALELERDDLKGIARFTKKGELQSKIDRKNEEIDILKIGLSGIAKRYGYKNVQEFYKIYHKSHSTYIAYREQEAEWEKIYGTDSQKQDIESILERLNNPSKRAADYQRQKIIKNKDRGAR